jgi:hypothetical protein
MDIFKKTALCVLVSASLVACGGGGGGDSASNNNGGTTGTTYKIENGAFQKGPFVAGTTVTIQELDANLQPTGKTYTTQTDDTGSFDVTGISSRFVEVFANGYYYDELNNAKSKGSVTLRAILDLVASSSKPSINTLTTLQTERLREVKKSGKSFSEAETDSKNAVLNVFGMPANTVARLDSINLTGTSAGDESLLRATVALLQVASNQSTSVEAELTSLLAKLATDLKDDGQPNNGAKDFVLSLRTAQAQVDIDWVRSQLQEYLQTKGGFEPSVIGMTPLPKLSEWLVVRRISIPTNEQSENVVWLLRDDGSVWKWQLANGQQLEKVNTVKDIVALVRASDANSLHILDKAGNAYSLNTQTQQAVLIDSSVKQIVEEAYLKQDGKVMAWDKTVLGMPLMSRFISSQKGGVSFANAGIGKDSQVYSFQQSSIPYSAPTGVTNLGKYGQAQSLLNSFTEGRNPAAILTGNTWHFLKTGKQQTLNTISAHTGGIELGVFTTLLAGDGFVWEYSKTIQQFIKTTCGSVKKAHRSEVVLLDDGTVRPLAYDNQGANATCPATAVFDHLSTSQVKDVFTLAGGLTIAVTSGGKLIARSYQLPQWQGAAAIYTVNSPN